MFKRISYEMLNSRQQENYNFQKAAARLADYGFNCIRLTDDWQGADFIAMHIDGETFLKVQLKGRLVIDRKYLGKAIHIAFFHGGELYLYDHDNFARYIEDSARIGEEAARWRDLGNRNWPSPPSWAIAYLADFRIAP